MYNMYHAGVRYLASAIGILIVLLLIVIVVLMVVGIVQRKRRKNGQLGSSIPNGAVTYPNPMNCNNQG